MNLNDSCDPNPILNQHLVETEKLYDMGVKNGAIVGDGIIVGDWRRIAAPPSTDMSSYSLIFWDSTNGDHKPTWDKVVSNLIKLSFRVMHKSIL